MTHVIVCTHRRHDLAWGAIESVRQRADDALRFTVLDSSGTLGPWGGVSVARIECRQYHHAAHARRLSRPGELTVCIDDDVRLASPVTLSERYSGGWYQPMNGHMVQAWTDPLTMRPCHRLDQWRASRRCEGLLPQLCQYAAATNAEQIDRVWLHIDKGSEPPTPERDALIRYIDQGPGLGDIVASGLSAVGITPERVSALTGKPCRCKERQQRLNEWGRRVGLGG